MPVIPKTPPAPAPAPQVSPAVADAVMPTLGATPVAANVTLGTPSDTSATSTNDGTTITMPTVGSATLPNVEGLEPSDAGDDAEFEVLHGYVDQHRQGSRLKREHFRIGADFKRLVRLGAIRVLKEGVDLTDKREDEPVKAVDAEPVDDTPIGAPVKTKKAK